MPRRPSRAVGREQRFQARRGAARTGRQLLNVAWDRLLAELIALGKVDPQAADRACKDLADQIEQIARDTAREVIRRADVPVR